MGEWQYFGWVKMVKGMFWVRAGGHFSWVDEGMFWYIRVRRRFKIKNPELNLEAVF